MEHETFKKVIIAEVIVGIIAIIILSISAFTYFQDDTYENTCDDSYHYIVVMRSSIPKNDVEVAEIFYDYVRENPPPPIIHDYMYILSDAKMEMEGDASFSKLLLADQQLKAEQKQVYETCGQHPLYNDFMNTEG